MKILGLFGKTGTGKSHNAMWIAKQNNIDYIVDDGLLIGQNKIIAGRSAKREKTKIASVKCALLYEPSLASEIKKAILSNRIKSLLIIGTSEKMLKSIAKTLELPNYEQIISINEIMPKDKIKTALIMRNTLGNHIIPVPTFEVKKHFSGYLVSPIKLIFKMIHGKPVYAEKTIVRPFYSYRGNYHISDGAIAEICNYSAKIGGAYKVLKIKIENVTNGEIDIVIDIVLKYPCLINRMAQNVLMNAKNSVENFTGININSIEINVRSIVVANDF